MAETVGDTRPRVVVIESIPLILRGLRAALEGDGCAVPAGTGDPHAGVRAVLEQKPEVVLVDLDLPGGAGIRLLQRLRRRCPATRLIATASPQHDADRLLLSALMAGATGYLLKDAETADVLCVVHAVRRGCVTLGPRAGGDLSDLLVRLAGTAETFPFPALTHREREVLRLVSLGYGNRRIARELFISEKTVRNYVSAILPKIHASSRSEAILSVRLAGPEAARPDAGPGTAAAGSGW
ncbi:response regulator transcription factor [Streptomyces sp. NPDC046215]|uniref:Response regulator transcription factor n=1 Tax=Streptomyces stramineus TaxID=173861 RepID=A0ABP3JBJ8_9ACTN